MNFLGVINPVALQLGPFQIRWYGIIIASAVILAVYLSVLEGRKQNILDDDIYDLLLYSLPVAIICARIYYVVFEWSYLWCTNRCSYSYLDLLSSPQYSNLDFT